MKTIYACFSKKSDEWATPTKIYQFFKYYGYYDPCPLGGNVDGLSIDWESDNFVNPPYSNLRGWVDKSIEQAEQGKRVVLLIPARTDTKAFASLWDYGCHFFFIRGRLKFSESKCAPFPSMFVLIDGDTKFCSYSFSMSVDDFLLYYRVHYGNGMYD